MPINTPTASQYHSSGLSLSAKVIYHLNKKVFILNRLRADPVRPAAFTFAEKVMTLAELILPDDLLNYFEVVLLK